MYKYTHTRAHTMPNGFAGIELNSSKTRLKTLTHCKHQISRWTGSREFPKLGGELEQIPLIIVILASLSSRLSIRSAKSGEEKKGSSHLPRLSSAPETR